jgi:hypothetical protein
MYCGEHGVACACAFPHLVCPLLGLCALQAVSARPDPWAGVTLFNTDIQALYSISIVVFGFNCHANVVSVSRNMLRGDAAQAASAGSQTEEWQTCVNCCSLLSA